MNAKTLDSGLVLVPPNYSLVTYCTVYFYCRCYIYIAAVKFRLVEIEYCLEHFGHDHGLQYLSWSAGCKAEAVARLKKGVPHQDCIRLLRGQYILILMYSSL